MTIGDTPEPPPDLARWLQLLRDTNESVAIVFHHRSVWTVLRDMLETNPHISHPPYTFGVMTEHYATSQVIALRRQCDTAPHNRTIARLLVEMHNEPGSITRSWYRSLYPPDSFMQEDADSNFDQWAGVGGDALQAAWCQLARTWLRCSIDPVRRYVNRRVAHLDGRPVVVPTFNDLNHATDAVGTIFLNLSLLLKGCACVASSPGGARDRAAGAAEGPTIDGPSK